MKKYILFSVIASLPLMSFAESALQSIHETRITKIRMAEATNLAALQKKEKAEAELVAAKQKVEIENAFAKARLLLAQASQQEISQIDVISIPKYQYSSSHRIQTLMLKDQSTCRFDNLDAMSVECVSRDLVKTTYFIDIYRNTVVVNGSNVLSF